MERVQSVVERIRTIPGARVDVGLYQGTRPFLAQLAGGIEEEIEDWSETNPDVIAFSRYYSELEAFVSPLFLPDDFVFFVKFYGGLAVQTAHYCFALEGIGPMAEEWYGYILGDDQFHENGFLNIGTLSLEQEGHFVSFFLDLAGVVQKHCTICIPELGTIDMSLAAILRDPRAYSKQWTKLADSFTEWLEMVAETNGTFGYV